MRIIELGTGRLTWDGIERRSNRYGAIWLMESGDSLSTGTPVRTIAKPSTSDIGLAVNLKVEVLETRKSTHVGDLFLKIYPSTPKVGEVILLGFGALAIELVKDSPRDIFSGDTPEDTDAFVLGVIPPDADNLALNPHALYRAHEQTVRLFAEVL